MRHAGAEALDALEPSKRSTVAERKTFLTAVTKAAGS